MFENDLKPRQLMFANSLRRLLMMTGVFGRAVWFKDGNEDRIGAYPKWIFKDMILDGEKENYLYSSKMPDESSLSSEEAMHQKLTEYISGFITKYMKGNRKIVYQSEEPIIENEEKNDL